MYTCTSLYLLNIYCHHANLTLFFWKNSKIQKMDQQNNSTYVGVGPPFSIPEGIMQNQQHQQLYFQNDPGFLTSSNPAPTSVPPVDFSTLQPDPSVMQYSGANFNPAMNTIPMPLLPTEPLPNLNPNPTKSPKKTPTKSKRKSDQGSPGQVPHKMIPEYVARLLEKRKDAFTDKEFADRALSNLVRKLASQAHIIEEWIRAVTDEDSNRYVCMYKMVPLSMSTNVVF